ncbi:MAG: hypothetical protein QMB94_03685, partial [Phycisphaerales bacterium]
MSGQNHHRSAARCRRLFRQGASLAVATWLSVAIGCDRPEAPVSQTPAAAQETVQTKKPGGDSSDQIPTARTIA